MSTRYAVQHRTQYRYSQRMSRGHTVTHLVPRRDGLQTVVSVSVVIDPPPDERLEFDDAFGNRVVQFVVASPHEQLTIVSESVVDVEEATLRTDYTAWDAPVRWSPEVAGFAAPSSFACPTPEVEAFAQPCFIPGRPLIDVTLDLCHRIFSEFRFDPMFTEVATPLAEVLRERRGVCQDFAHLAIACLRAHGIPARYVSGYLETVPPLGEPKLVGADASHAWLSVALADGTWLDIDPTNDQAPPRHHIVVAYGRDYLDVAPVLGVVLGPMATQELSVQVDVNVVV